MKIEKLKCDIKVKMPIEAFSKCPCCKSKRLHPIGEQVLCLDCNWISIEAFIECGGLDQLIREVISHKKRSSQNKKTKPGVRKAPCLVEVFNKGFQANIALNIA